MVGFQNMKTHNVLFGIEVKSSLRDKFIVTLGHEKGKNLNISLSDWLLQFAFYLSIGKNVLYIMQKFFVVIKYFIISLCLILQQLL